MLLLLLLLLYGDASELLALLRLQLDEALSLVTETVEALLHTLQASAVFRANIVVHLEGRLHGP